MLGMACKVIELGGLRVSRHDASAGQQGPMNPRLALADVVPLPTLQAHSLSYY